MDLSLGQLLVKLPRITVPAKLAPTQLNAARHQRQPINTMVLQGNKEHAPLPVIRTGSEAYNSSLNPH
jgi:hypothetical protein